MISIRIILTLLLIANFCTCGKYNSQEQELTISFMTYADISVNHSQLVLNTSTGIVSYNNVPFSGCSTKYQDSLLVESICYHQGKKHAIRKKWFPNGQISYQAHYSIGKLHGISQTWWKNGNLRSESLFVDGKLNGIQKQWYQSGAKFKELNIVNGKEEGMQKAWRENGVLYNNYEAKNGRIFGMRKASLCFELDDEKVQYAD